MRSYLGHTLILVACVTLAPLCLAQSTDEPPVFEQPEDPQARLQELDDVVVQKQKALFAARMRGDPEEIKKAQEEFEAVQKQRSRAVRALEQHR
jgi:hypothetical protein